MRTLTPLFALLLAACGSDEPTSTEAPAPTMEQAPAPGEAQPSDQAGQAAADGAVSCDAFADHMLAAMEKQAEAAEENEFMTKEQAKQFAASMVEGIREGCKRDDRLSEFPNIVGCFMEASEEPEYQACKNESDAEAFDEYMKGLLAASIRLGPGGAPEGAPAAQ